jgi:SAM-dependent methyltransferase
MKENIGKIEITYFHERRISEDPEAHRLLSFAERILPEEWDQMVAREKSWPVLKHFSHLRENLVEWIPCTGEERVLELGAQCGALTGILSKKAASLTCVEEDPVYCRVNANRYRDRENIRILCGSIQEVEPVLDAVVYDLIFLIGVLPRSGVLMEGKAPAASLLRFAASHLAPGGRIVLAQENRIGLKYWAGCRDEYNGSYFAGPEGNLDEKRGKTYTRSELRCLVQDSVGMQAEFYYPYPDHMFPLSIYSDHYLPKKGDLNGNYCNYDADRLQLFDEAKVYGTLIENQLYPEFANSFLVILTEA